MEIREGLELPSKRKQRAFRVRWSDKLQADRQTVCETAWHENARKSGEIRSRNQVCPDTLFRGSSRALLLLLVK